MNKNRNALYLIAVLLPLTLFSCRDNTKGEREPVPVKRELTLTLEPGKWIYYSIADSTVKGKSDIGDTVQDTEWGGRSDWDIALSEAGLRTNSGTSGRGNGGVTLLSDSLYDALERESSFIGLDYKADTLGVNVIRPLKD